MDRFEYVAGKDMFSTVGFEAVKPVLMKFRTFWHHTTCRLVISCGRFGGEDCHHLQSETYKPFAYEAVAA